MADSEHGRRPARGLSLVEIILALLIASIAAGSIISTLTVTKEQYVRVDVMITGQLLAQSILEQAVYGYETNDRRFFTLDTTPSDLRAAIAQERWKEPFLLLQQPRTPVITPAGVPNPYFDPTFGPHLPLASDDGSGQRFLANFSYEVRTDFVRAEEEEGPSVAIDVDGDSKPETDLARLVVEVYYRPPRPTPMDPLVATMSTFLFSPDKVPGTEIDP